MYYEWSKVTDDKNQIFKWNGLWQKKNPAEVSGAEVKSLSLSKSWLILSYYARNIMETGY